MNADPPGTPTVVRTSPTTGEELELPMISGGADPHIGRGENQDSKITEDIVQGAVGVIEHSMGSVTTAPGDQDPADDQARIIHHLGTETDIPRMTGDKILGNDQEAPTPTTTGEGITAGTIGMIDTPGAIQGKEIDPKTQDTDSRAIPTVTKAEDSDSSRLGIDEACPQRSTSSR